MGLNAPFNQFVNVVASASAPIEYGNPAAVDPLFTGAGALGAFGVSPHLRDSRVSDWNFTVEQALPANIFLNVGYVGTHGSRLTAEWDANRAINPSLPGTPIVRPNPNFGAIFVAGSIGTSDYHSLQAQLLRRVGKASTRWLHTHSPRLSEMSTVGILGQPIRRIRFKIFLTWTLPVQSKASIFGIGCPSVCSMTCHGSIEPRSGASVLRRLASQCDHHGADWNWRWRHLRQ